MENSGSATDEIRRKILAVARVLASRDGWLGVKEEELAERAGVSAEAIRLFFPRGGVDLACFYLKEGDRQLEEVPPELFSSVEGKSVRERIADLIMARLRLEDGDRVLARKTTALFGLPLYWADGMRCLAHTSDMIWRLVDGESGGATDFSYYTKRATLAIIYSHALIFYLSPKGKSEERLRRFVEGEINLLMKTATFFGRSRSSSGKRREEKSE